MDTQEWQLDPSMLYLNHAAVAPWPKRTVDAINEFSQQNLISGSSDYPNWIKTEAQLKDRLCRLINAHSPDEVALIKNTSEGLSLVAYGLEWQRGENIVTSNQEFPSNRIVWESLADKGVSLRAVDLYKAETPEQALINACDENTRLLTISSVQYASGLKVDLNTLGKFCKTNNILFCVDSIQSTGAMQVDVQADHIDFMAADSHKWMLGPEGIGFFYCAKHRLDTLKLNQYGWHMVQDMGNYDNPEWQIASSARRFECGSPNMLGIHAFNASLSLLLEVGMDKVESKILDKTRLAIDFINSHTELELISSANEGRIAGIITFKHRNTSSEQLYKGLMNKGVMCAWRGGGVRFSPHYYTPNTVLLDALEMSVEI